MFETGILWFEGIPLMHFDFRFFPFLSRLHRVRILRGLNREDCAPSSGKYRDRYPDSPEPRLFLPIVTIVLFCFFFFLFCNSFLLIYRLINRGKFVISRCSKLLYWNHSSLYWHYKKVHDLQSLSPAVEDGEDDGRPWISHKSGDTKSPKESKELPSVHSLSKLDGDIGKFCPAVMGYNLIWLLF